MTAKHLSKLWDWYAEAGCENVYQVPAQRNHRYELSKLFLLVRGSVYLDLGCGTGGMFESIAEIIQPSVVHAADWSEQMLVIARVESERMQIAGTTRFEFHLNDFSEKLPWPDSYFDGVVSNHVACYVTCGWKTHLRELARVTKLGGYLYMGTLLKGWSFESVLYIHGPWEIIKDPIPNLRGLKYRRILSKIFKEAKRQGAELPPMRELMNSLKLLGYEDISVVRTFWGGGLALRAKLTSK